MPSIQHHGVAYLQNPKRKVVSPYIHNRMLHIGENSTVQTACGVPQGSVMGPTL